MSRGVVLASMCAGLLLVGQAPAAASPGDVYVADLGGETIWRVGPNGGDATPFATGPDFNPAGLAFDRSGNILAADYGPGNEAIWLVDRETGAISTFFEGPPVVDPHDVALAPDGSVLIASPSGGEGGTPAVFRVDPVTKELSTVADGSPPFDFTARGLSVKRDGTILVADDPPKRIAPTGEVTDLTGPSPLFGSAQALALTADERALFVGSYDGDAVIRADTSTGAFDTFAPVESVIGLTVRPDRSLLASDFDSGTVWRVDPTGSPVTVFSQDPAYVMGEIADTLVEPARCGGRIPSVVGTTGRDVLTGSAFADVFSALGGSDVIRAVAGNDTVCGGKRRDRLVGGAGRDRLVGGAGRDRLVGGKGRDRLVGGPGPDLCIGGPGRDRERSC